METTPKKPKRLTPDQVRTIRLMGGIRGQKAALARQFGVSFITVTRALRRETHRKVTDEIPS